MFCSAYTLPCGYRFMGAYPYGRQGKSALPYGVGNGNGPECNAMVIQGFTNCLIDIINILIFMCNFLKMLLLILCLQLYKLQSRGEVSLTVTSDTQC